MNHSDPDNMSFDATEPVSTAVSPTPLVRSTLSQLRNNWLALASLMIALFGLGYNTYRNETSEVQRNVRQAGFMVLSTLGELQTLVDTRFFGNDHSETNRIAIWGRVVFVRDMATLVSARSQQQAAHLFEIWAAHGGALDDGDTAAELTISRSVTDLRNQLLDDLRTLR